MSFSTVLVANRGEIARRVIRGVHDAGLRAVAIYVDADEFAPYVGDADAAVHLLTGYLDGAAVLEAARRSGADAVHPGYGFLSENAGFAESVVAAGLTWIGPPAMVIATMGDKLAAKALAEQAGVALLPSSDDAADATSVGYPLMVKAAAGGGGKGMRVVANAEELDESVAAARREAFSAFGDDRVFLERFVARSRHVEIQILGDAHGNLVHLGERDCSIQRRHQKLIEESPSPALDRATRSAMGEAALSLARAIGYQSAGTVEFLVDDESGDFYFLEVNTRLQVEHPVTEVVTGIDLVREQLRVAAGDELGYDQSDVHWRGWSMEARLCAEDPRAGFLPAAGTIAAFEPATTPVVRWESGVAAGSVIGVSFDPLLAKVVSYGDTRREAAATLALALENLHLGGVTTNRDFLVAVLRNEHFLAGQSTTDFIERVNPSREPPLDEGEELYVARAAALWLQGQRRHVARVWRGLPSGWRNARLPRQCTTLQRDDESVDVAYETRRDGSFSFENGDVARVHAWRHDGLDLSINGLRRDVRVTEATGHVYVQARRTTLDFAVVPRFSLPGSAPSVGGLGAPMPGVILEVRAEVGQPVAAGETLVVMEAMKMEHVISAPVAGTVGQVFVHVGQQVQRGDELLTVDRAAEAT